ncbi:SdpI family protein [Patescibacteria group bacterium]|nr:SdpI family protein [Patescibacteria group bacterium]MBU1448774.1 SdpI family protein [Patescibacteria group bacterium]MBU2613406.1 SdpI family protein [Patescibacteria group bacterium]
MTHLTRKPIDAMLAVRISLVALMFIAAAIIYPYLPDIIPTHWGIEGVPKGWSPKTWGAWIMPPMSLAFLVLFPFLSKLDPKRENYEKFKQPWSVIQTSLVALLAYMFLVTNFVTFYPQYNDMVGRAVVLGIGVLFVVLGNVMGKVRQNYFIGLKTPWTLDNPEVWQKSQRFAGWAFVISGLVFIIESIIWIAIMPVFVVMMGVMVLMPIVYSYLLSRDIKKM